jgi:hypothetical protein
MQFLIYILILHIEGMGVKGADAVLKVLLEVFLNEWKSGTESAPGTDKNFTRLNRHDDRGGKHSKFLQCEGARTVPSHLHLNTRCKLGHTPLLRICKHLDPREHGRTVSEPYGHGAEDMLVNAARVLLSPAFLPHLDLSCRDNDGFTALQLACIALEPKLVKLLLDAEDRMNGSPGVGIPGIFSESLTSRSQFRSSTYH